VDVPMNADQLTLREVIDRAKLEDGDRYVTVLRQKSIPLGRIIEDEPIRDLPLQTGQLAIRDGDVLIFTAVPFRESVSRAIFVGGRVKRSGVYMMELDRPISLARAIIAAGGADGPEDALLVQVARRTPEMKESEFVLRDVRLDDLLGGRMKDIELTEHDQV